MRETTINTNHNMNIQITIENATIEASETTLTLLNKALARCELMKRQWKNDVQLSEPTGKAIQLAPKLIVETKQIDLCIE